MAKLGVDVGEESASRGVRRQRVDDRYMPNAREQYATPSDVGLVDGAETAPSTVSEAWLIQGEKGSLFKGHRPLRPLLNPLERAQCRVYVERRVRPDPAA